MSNELESKNVSRLFFKFAVPSIVGMLIVSIQMMVDGIFIANTQGASGLAAINLSMPIILFTNSIALMIAAGGGVYCSIALGKGKFKRANEIMSFTLQIFVVFLGSISLLGFLFINGIIGILGATEILAPLVKAYLLTMLVLNIPYNIPIFTEGFIKIAGKPNLVFLSCMICLIGNVLMDYLFIVKLDMGVFGAALATSIANGTAGVVLMWNYFKNRSRLNIVKPNGSRILLGKILYNGSSEMLTMGIKCSCYFYLQLYTYQKNRRNRSISSNYSFLCEYSGKYMPFWIISGTSANSFLQILELEEWNRYTR